MRRYGIHEDSQDWLSRYGTYLNIGDNLVDKALNVAGRGRVFSPGFFAASFGRNGRLIAVAAKLGPVQPIN